MEELEAARAAELDETLARLMAAELDETLVRLTAAEDAEITADYVAMETDEVEAGMLDVIGEELDKLITRSEPVTPMPDSERPPPPTKESLTRLMGHLRRLKR